MSENELKISVSIDDVALQGGLVHIVRDLQTTQDRINQIGSRSSVILVREAERTANARIKEENRSAREVERINKQTQREAEKNERILERSAKQLADQQIKEAKRASNALIAELKQTEAAAKESSSVFSSAFAGGAVGGLAVGAAGAAASFIAQIPAQAIAAGRAFFDLTKSASDYGSAIFDASQKTNLNARSLSTIKYAAEISGSSLESFTSAFFKFEKAQDAALSGNKEAAVAFQRFGVDLHAGPEAALSQFLKRYDELGPSSNRNTEAAKIFGKGVADLIPTFQQLGGNFEAAQKQADALGLTIDDRAAAAADRFGDTLDTVNKQLKGVGYTVGNEFLPAFQIGLDSVSTYLSDNQESFKRWSADTVDLVLGVSSVIGDFGHSAQVVFNDANAVLGFFGSSVKEEIIALDSLYTRLATFGLVSKGLLQSLEEARSAGTQFRLKQENLNAVKSTNASANTVLERIKKGFTGAGDEGGISEASKKATEDYYKSAGIARQKFFDDQKRINDESSKFVGIYSNLLTQSKAENPYVRIFNDGDTAIAKFKTELKGISPEFAKLYADLQTTINSKSLFTARLDTALGAFDLRDQAATFRNPDRTQLSVQERLTKQIDLVNQQTNRANDNPDALAIADRKLISLTSNFRPNELTSSQRDVAASAREREAVRLESAEKDAQKQRIDMAAATKSLAADMKEILATMKSGKGFGVHDVAAGEGGGQEVTVTVKKDGADVSVTGPAMNNANLNIPLTGGANGLTNR